jgi:Protein of unknown function (DUF3631)/Bifunctional DNA primase/polymerase, N-terminal
MRFIGVNNTDGSTTQGGALYVPDIDPETDTLTAALAYAEAGWYVLPTDPAVNIKSPGSVVGDHWQDKSSRDPKQIAAWLAGTDYGIALHCGRSGAVAFDVDTPDKLAEILRDAFNGAPFQSSRPGQPERGHHMFAMPFGRTIGNSTGKLGGEWGEVRGLNGVIVVAPTQHSDEGGEYRWKQTGLVPELPATIADMLDDASPAEDAASDAVVQAFIKQHTSANSADMMDKLITALRNKIDAGESRHGAAVSAVAGAMKEARAGYYSAEAVLAEMRKIFVNAVQQEPKTDKQGAKRTKAQAESEWRGIVAWGVGQANGHLLAEVCTPVPGDAEPVNGAKLLDAVSKFLARFVAYPSDHALVAHTLWIAHTWLMDCWDSTPRIAFLSPEPGSGKTRALEVSEPLVPNPIHSVNVTSAYLFRRISDLRPTLLYDEIDTVFGPKAKENEDIRAVINSGHRNGATSGRCVVKGKRIETEDLPSYCAVAMAGLNDLPDTIMDRSIVVRMQRRSPTERVEPWRVRVNEPQAAPLRDQLATWAAQVKSAATDSWPEIPEKITDRAADCWESLLAVADLAGGHWPATARVSAVTLVTESRDKEPSLGVMLLRDVKTIFTNRDAVSLETAELLRDLKGIPESPWKYMGKDGTGLTPRGLAKILRKYEIGPKPTRISGQVVKGYERGQFAEAWKRYPSPSSDDDASVLSEKSVTAVTFDNDAGQDDF